MSYVLARPSSAQRSSLLGIVIALHLGLLTLIIASRAVVPQIIATPLIVDLPVSYTHLDVYKRQEQYIGRRQPEQSLTAPAEHFLGAPVDETQPLPGIESDDSLAEVVGDVVEHRVAAAQMREGEAQPGKDPVSYTHLDVYKRQVVAGGGAPCSRHAR